MYDHPVDAFITKELSMSILASIQWQRKLFPVYANKESQRFGE